MPPHFLLGTWSAGRVCRRPGAHPHSLRSARARPPGVGSRRPEQYL